MDGCGQTSPILRVTPTYRPRIATTPLTATVILSILSMARTVPTAMARTTRGDRILLVMDLPGGTMTKPSTEIASTSWFRLRAKDTGVSSVSRGGCPTVNLGGRER